MKKIAYMLILLVVLATLPLGAQVINDMSFVNKPIVDILFALGAFGQKTIIPDETVHGNANYYIYNQEFDRALRVFLDTYKLYLRIDSGVYYVSKIRIEYSPETDRVNIDAEEVNMRMIIDAISKEVKKTILYDTLPTLLLTIHQKNITPTDLLNVVTAPAPDYKLETFPTHYYIKYVKQPTATSAPGTSKEGFYFEKCGDGLYCISKSKVRFKELVYELFKMEGREVQVLFPRDILIDETLKFQNKTFDEMLRLILEQGNADFYVNNGIYYIVEVAQRDIQKKLKTTMIIQLKYITAQDLQRLFPPDLGISEFYRIDPNENFVILNGNYEEIAPVKQFIDALDKPLPDSHYYRFNLNFLKAQNVFNYLPEPYKFQRIVQVPEANAFLMPLSREKKAFLDDYLKIVDRPIGSFEVKLKYIKSEDLLKKLPPSVLREDIMDTQDPSIVFFKGTKEKYDVFRRELDIFDQPVPQIRYQVLVVSYNDGETMDWQKQQVAGEKIANLTYEGDAATDGPVTSSIGSLLGLNFNVPQLLGWKASLNLNWALSTNNAQVVTDTMIYALSGEKVNFQDTETIRYVSTTTSTTGTGVTTGTTQSFDIGFTLNLDGWVSGDEMITMKVNLKMSNRGSGDVNISTGNLPSTYDKSIETKSRTKSGEPIKIGGLIRDNVQTTIEKVPFLGDIPLLGYIFKREQEVASKSEIVVYILPHIIYSAEERLDTGRKLNRLYTKYFAPNMLPAR